MIQILIGGFLIAHGLVHLAVWATPKQPDAPFDASDSWLLGPTKGLSMVLAVVAAVVLVAGGIALFADVAVWQPLTIAGLAVSLLLDVLYFNLWFGFITMVNAVFLAMLILANWSPIVSDGV
jgi:hypothetical protein